MSVSIEKAITHLKDGGIVIYPTDTVWGLGCNALNEKAVRQLRKIKGKAKNGMSIVLPNIETVKTFCKVSRNEEEILKKNLPGPFTFILKTSIKFPEGVCLNGKVGVRIPKNNTAIKLSSEFPVISTSANKHGKVPADDIEDAKAVFGSEILYLDGEKPLGIESTIVDVDNGEVEVIRNGAGYLKLTEL